MPLADSDDVNDLFDVPDLTLANPTTNGSSVSFANAPTIIIDNKHSSGSTDTSPTNSSTSSSEECQSSLSPLNNVTEIPGNDGLTLSDACHQNVNNDNKIDLENPIPTVSISSANEAILSSPQPSAVNKDDSTEKLNNDSNIGTLSPTDDTCDQPVQQQSNNEATSSISISTASNLYSIVLPGVGKVLAVNSNQSCDVDTLFDEQMKACDVDAYVNVTDDDDSSELDDACNKLRVYTSPNKFASTIAMDDDDDNNVNHLVSSSTNDTEDYDVEANRESVASIIRRVNESSSIAAPLDPQCDPFAKRRGKTLSWRNVNMTLQTRKGEKKKILNNVWGEVPSTETTAIMGASGAGKTSLLNVLAGRARTRGRISIESDVRLENYSVDPTSIQIRKSIAFVAQDDSLIITATPREAIRFSAKLRLPRSITNAQIDILTTRMLEELGLATCADTIVGGPLIKGLSGGERKRASVGVELVVKPAMVFLDEPTSGLDSFSAVQVCQVLKKVANSGASVLFTIHQPSSEIFNSFDRLILLHKGRVLFQGPVKDIPSSFASCGYPVPTNYNPADWVVNVAQKHSISDLEASGFFQKDQRKKKKPTKPVKGENLLGEKIVNRGINANREEEPPGLWAQTTLLYRRELTYMYRFPLPLYGRFGFTAFLSFLIGIIFYKVGDASTADPFNITSQFGAMMILLMLAMLGTAQPALLFFPEERPIFLREYSTDHYSVMSYFGSRLLVEMMNTGVQILIMATLIYFMVSFNGSVWIYFAVTYSLAMSGTAMAVMLGVLAEGNAKFAQQLLPLLFIPQLLFSGFFVSPALMPTFLQWAQYVCVLTYAVRILIIEEFQDCSTNPTEARNCQNLIENVRAEPDSLLFYWSMLVIFFIVFRTLALFLLRKSATKFY